MSGPNSGCGWVNTATQRTTDGWTGANRGEADVGGKGIATRQDFSCPTDGSSEGNGTATRGGKWNDRGDNSSTGRATDRTCTRPIRKGSRGYGLSNGTSLNGTNGGARTAPHVSGVAFLTTSRTTVNG